MLSPKARNRVAEIRGAGRTVTVNVQKSVSCVASLAVHVTFDIPTGNDEPLGGVQPNDTGGVPPATRGDANVTVAVTPIA
jgi:hypothetical protein